MKIESKAYKLYNTIQNYNWGTKNEDAFIPNLLGIEAVKDIPYAELWIGAHPKASSEILIENKMYRLNEIVEKIPREILGNYVAKKFDNKLPYLLKVLSAARALSIQTHPNKKQAEMLNKKDPIHYQDDNHKPEIAIAIDKLSAIAGFRPVEEIKKVLNKYSEIKEFVGNTIVNSILNGNEKDIEINIKNFYKAVMKKAEDKEDISILINNLVKNISLSSNLITEEKQFLEQYKIYGYDIGLISLFLFNSIELKPKQAIFTDAGIPHAYIKGNIIECMANSDNVIRAGLTEKFKDIDVLLDVLNYQFAEYEIINKEQATEEVVYKTTASEFEVTIINKSTRVKSELVPNNKPIIYLVTEGSVEIIYESNSFFENETFNKGEAFLIPAIVKMCNLNFIGNTELVRVDVP